MAEYQEVAKMYDRLCESYDECYKCPMFRHIDKNSGPMGCRYWTLIVDPETAEKVILHWGKEHPPKTNRDKFREVFGMDIITNCNSGTCQYDWANQEYKEPKKEDQNG